MTAPLKSGGMLNFHASRQLSFFVVHISLSSMFPTCISNATVYWKRIIPARSLVCFVYSVYVSPPFNVWMHFEQISSSFVFTSVGTDKKKPKFHGYIAACWHFGHQVHTIYCSVCFGCICILLPHIICICITDSFVDIFRSICDCRDSVVNVKRAETAVPRCKNPHNSKQSVE